MADWHKPQGPFDIPDVPNYIPRKLKPWLFVFFVLIIQFSGGVYLAAASDMVGTTALMQEDILMAGYAQLIGMSLNFAVMLLHCADSGKHYMLPHRLRPGFSCDMLLCRMVQNVGYIRLQLDNTALDNPGARHGDILLLCLHNRRQRHPAQRNSHCLYRILLPMGIHAFHHDRATCPHAANGIAFCQAGKGSHANTTARHRLDRIWIMGRRDAMLHIYMCLRQLL